MKGGDMKGGGRSKSLQIGLRGIRVIIKGVGEDKENVKFARERKNKDINKRHK